MAFAQNLRQQIAALQGNFSKKKISSKDWLVWKLPENSFAEAGCEAPSETEKQKFTNKPDKWNDFRKADWLDIQEFPELTLLHTQELLTIV